MYPDASDGLVLTGFSANATFLPDFLLGGAFIQANQIPALSDYVDGYFAPAYEGGAHINFFAPDNFDPAILTAAYKTGQPVTVGELLTIGGEAGTTSGFKKPVLVITGGKSLSICGNLSS